MVWFPLIEEITRQIIKVISLMMDKPYLQKEC